MKRKKKTGKPSSDQIKLLARQARMQGRTLLQNLTNNALTTFPSGAQRGTSLPYRYDLICPSALRRLARTYDEGAKRYGENNWLQGIPDGNLFNHAMTHLQAFASGDTSEDHLAHAAWNIFALMHFEEPFLIPGNPVCTHILIEGEPLREP